MGVDVVDTFMNDQHLQEIERLQRENGALRLEVARLSSWQGKAEVYSAQLQRISTFLQRTFPGEYVDDCRNYPDEVVLRLLKNLSVVEYELSNWVNWARSYINNPRKVELQQDLRVVLTRRLSLLVSLKTALSSEDC